MRLQGKLTIALLITGLLSASSVAAVAYWMLMRDFRSAIMEQSYTNFSQDVQAYLTFFNTADWHQADAQMSFSQFVRRYVRTPRHLPPPPTAHRQPSSIEDSFQITPQPSVPPFDPSLQVGRHGQAPFNFLILSPEGKVLKPVEGYPAGMTAPQQVIRQARPILFNGEVAILASPIGEPILSNSDRAYLNAMQQALMSGIGVALVLALLIGLVGGSSMSHKLTSLTRAIRKLQADKTHQSELKISSRDELGELAQAFNQMNRELCHAHQELVELSIRDPLTGLYNRRYFDEQAASQYQQALRYNTPLTVMVCDLDHFKRINDDFSHLIGDRVLAQVARLMKRSTRNSDIVARFGGEEFVILFPNTTLEQAQSSCEALRHQIEQHPWGQLNPKLKVTISIGLSDALELGGIEQMIAQADDALYVAKQQGRNQVALAAQACA